MNLTTCELCGGRLESFEGESYCPDCTYSDAILEAERATDEALALLALEPVEPDVMDWRGEQPPC
jgi:hypothetical protein